jgi:hypothetical protein
MCVDCVLASPRIAQVDPSDEPPSRGVDEEVDSAHEPVNYFEAILSTDSKKWMSAKHDEMESHEKNDTWDSVHLPLKKKVVKCKWFFKREEGMPANEPAWYKARLVAKGFSQIPEIDYTDVYSPVVKHSSIHTFFSLIVMHDYELEQLDVKISFLHVDLEEDIYMDQPEGFAVPKKQGYMCAGWWSPYMAWNNFQKSGIKYLIHLWFLTVFKGRNMIVVFISSLLVDHLHICCYMLMICWLLLRAWKNHCFEGTP